MPLQQEIIIFLASLAGVGAIVLIAHFLGFSSGPRISGEDEIREMLRLAPGGFEPDVIAIDAHGQAAIARSIASELAVAFLHGNKIVVRVLGPQTRAHAENGDLQVASSELGPKPLKLHLGDAAADWATPEVGDR